MICEWKTGSPYHPKRYAKVFDADTGEHIPKVRYIDTETNELRRFFMDDNGQLLIENSEVKMITENRKVRIEWGENCPSDEAK